MAARKGVFVGARSSARAWRRRAMVVGAIAFTTVLTVDPFGLSPLPGWLAQAEETAESRSDNVQEAMERLGIDGPVPATELSGGWNLDDSGALAVAPAVLPDADEETVSVPSAGGSAPLDLGGMSVEVAAADEGTAPDAVTVKVASSEDAEAAGVDGLLLDVVDAGQTAVNDGEVALTVSYATFAGAGDADWASRLRFVHVPDCDASGDAECTPTPLETVNDPVTQTVTAVVPVTTAAAPEDETPLAPDEGGTESEQGATEPAPEQTTTPESEDEATPGDEVGTDPTAPQPQGDASTPQASGRIAQMASLHSTVAPAAAGGGLLALVGGASGPDGNWAATSLSPSASWGTSGASGAFTWSYDIPVPSAAAGPEPELSLSYSSAASDGRVPSTNNQAGWIGEGFDLTSGYIERSYVPCATDEGAGANSENRATADLCWGPDNATLVFKGTAVQLVKDTATGAWVAKNEDGSRVEHLTGGWGGGQGGEYWKVTTTDGVQYFFGRGKRAASDPTQLQSAWTVPVYGNHPTDPCYKGPAEGGFAASRCDQVWRWNLDYVVDPSGNSMTYVYEKETNHYVPDYTANTQWEAVPYVSGGRLLRIEYGTRSGQETSSAAPARVTFQTAPRCLTDPADGTALCSSSTSSPMSKKWPETPKDLVCDATTDCDGIVPVFFDRTRLTGITTQVNDGSTYRYIDTWALTQRFVAEGAGGTVQYATNVTLRLDKIQRTARGGTSSTSDDITVNPIRFGYEFLQNRVDADGDGHPPMWRPRVDTVQTDSGAQIGVVYRTECTAADVPEPTDAAQAANDRLCYPVRWQPEGEGYRTDWFHKYVVELMREEGAPSAGGDDLITGSVAKTTTYAYEGGAGWAKPTGPLVKADEVTYSDFRGFATVKTTLGVGEEATTSTNRYYRGLGQTLTAGPSGHTVSVTDREEFAGQVFATKTTNGSKTVSETVTKPGTPVTVATGANGIKATRSPSSAAYGFSFDGAGALEYRTRTVTSFDENAQPVSIDDRGDLSTSADDVCTTIEYADDSGLASKNMVSLPAKTEVVSATCGAAVDRPAQVISSDLAEYDGSGRRTRSKSLDPSDGDGYVTVSEVRAYDSRGRATETADADGNVSTVTYSQNSAGMVTQVVERTPDPDGSGPLAGFTTTRKFSGVTGVLKAELDANGRGTAAAYDALGRITRVRFAQHVGLTPPSLQYEYIVRENGLNAVVTRTLGADGVTQHASVVAYDGLLRPFQTQTEGVDTGADHDDSVAARGRMVTQTYYDSAGRVKSATGKWWAQGAVSSAPVTPIAVAPSHTTYSYDKAGRVTDEVFWIGTDSNSEYEKWRTKTIYDGATTLTIPPAGGVPSAVVVDARGQKIELKEYPRDPETQAGADTAAEVTALPSQSTTYAYDPAGRMVSMQDPDGNEWSYSYDWADRQVEAVDPDSGTSTTAYDALGRVVSTTNGNGERLAYTYDALGRKLTMRDGSTSGPVRARWEYDTAVDEDGDPVLGQLARAVRVQDGREYATEYARYDEAYRPLDVDTVLPQWGDLKDLSGQSFRTSYAYTFDGQVEQLTLPGVERANGSSVLGSEIVTTRFDAASMPSWMGGGFGWGVYVAESRFSADGKPLVQDLGNTYGAAVSYHWEDGTDRLSRVSLDRERVSGTEVDLAYGYDDVGNVTSVVDAPSNAAVSSARDVQCFDYDGLRRLQAAWTASGAECGSVPGSWSGVGGPARFWAEYSYDVLGNRTSVVEYSGSGSSTYTYGYAGEGPHQVTSVTGSGAASGEVTEFAWDAAGRQVSRDVGGSVTDLQWDAEGELSGLSGAEDAGNVFSADGDRLVRFESGAVTVFLPGGQEASVSASGVVSASRWYSFAGQTVAVRSGAGLSGVVSVVTDHHGSVVARVPNTDWGAGVSRVWSDPFGNARSQGSVSVAGRGFLNAPQDGSGLVMMGARFYDPGVAGFVSVDPKLDPDVPAQFHAYVYSGNNPLTWSDPSGEAWLLEGSGSSNGTVAGSAKGVRHKAKTGNNTIEAVVPKVLKPSTPFDPFRTENRDSHGCVKGDWSCMAAVAASGKDCRGAGKFRRCQGVKSDWGYSYEYTHKLDIPSLWTPEKVMSVFKSNAARIFPFDVQGCRSLTGGEICHLKTSRSGTVLSPNGVVGVTETPTSVKFTVIDRGYFDSPGSTIKFSAYADAQGNVYLVQTGNSHGSDLAVVASITYANAARQAWDRQAANLENLLRGE